MTAHLHILNGCAPVPLANYLKALGILRLVSEQADCQARGWWDGERFCLLTALSPEELEAFFLKTYEPTPILSPWNKGSGFFKPDDPAMRPLEKSAAPRFGRFRGGIKAGRDVIGDIARADLVIRAIKARTKTARKSFQTPAQWEAVKASDSYREIVASIEEQLKMNALPERRAAELKDGLETLRSIISEPSGPPSKNEAKHLKESRGYKQLLAAAENRFKALKSALVPECRRQWRGGHAEWVAAAVVPGEQGKLGWPSLLGTGGNDGNLDFTNNFMQQLANVFDVKSDLGSPKAAAAPLLKNSLWEEPSNGLVASAIGQFQPGAAGGANSSTGFEDGMLANPWDFIFMLEGAILLSSRVTRRLDPAAAALASAPFAVHSHAAGFATPGSEKAKRGEQWMPLWRQPAKLPEVSAMFGEGRVQLGRQTANRPVDIVRAISRFGVARGIEAFVRYGYLERNGQSTLAVPLGQVEVRERPRAYLIDDLAGWVGQIQRRSRDKNAPSRLAVAEKRLVEAVFAALTHDHTPERWQAILLAGADVESLQASGTAFEAGPIPPLRPEWVAAADDGSAEVRLALALGSAAARYEPHPRGRPADSVRHHWLPLDERARNFMTAEARLVNHPRVVAAGRDTIRDLSAVVERRLIEATMDGQRHSRLVAAAGCDACLEDLASFLAGQLDVDLIVGLARAFMAIDWGKWKRDCAISPESVAASDRAEIAEGPRTPPHIDETWLSLRLCLLPCPLGKSHDIPADERIVRPLMAGDAPRAIEIARRRLIAVGIRPPFLAGMAGAEITRLWAAALVFPISQATARCIAGRLDPRFRI